MAEQLRRNAGGSQPISQHPLFPAIVALWFGALFGLGSIAIRPALIEHAVLAIGLDSVIPMAAPPLGTTTRILFALAMTGLGGLIGALIARRIARPATEVHERRRGAVPMADKSAPAAPVAAAEFVKPAETARPAEAARPGAALPGRRRALAIFEDNSAADPIDIAKLPGHGAQILNVAEFDLDGFEQTAAPVAPVAAATDAGTLDAQEGPIVGAAHLRDDVEAEAALDDTGSHAGQDTFVSPPPGAQLFQLGADAAGEPPFASPVADVSPVAVEPRGNRLFETYSREITARASNPAPGAPSPVPETAPEPGFKLLPRLNVAGWGDVRHDNAPAIPQPRALFEQPQDMAETAEEFDLHDGDVEDGTVQDETTAEAAVAEAAAPDQATQHEADPALVFGAGIGTSAAERIVAAELDDLSPVELLERLALAMAQRREDVRLAAAAAMAPAEPAPEPDPQPGMLAAAQDFDASNPSEALMPEAVASAPAMAEPVAEALAQPASALPVFTSPGFAAPEMAEAPFAAPLPAAELPAALRPIGFDAGDDWDADEDDALPGYIPPRHIGLTAASAPPITDADEGEEFEDDNAPTGSASIAEIAFDEDESAADEDLGEDEDADVLEQGYSSLLDLSRPAAPRQPFVRIDEPEDDGEIQPVVIFPGEDAPGSAPFARPGQAAAAWAPSPVVSAAPSAPLPAASPAAGRLFDAPGKADPAETERALRAALATLQRMSGAA